MEQAIIFNIQRFSVHDGPGIRTTVFFKGCPLNCLWCHNPESKAFGSEIHFFPQKCIHCGRCSAVCPHLDSCVACGLCASVCPVEARQVIGEVYSEDQIWAEIVKDRLFYEESGGGVTFSGGEALAQPEFLLNILKRCQEKGVHTVVDTSGYAPRRVIAMLAPYVDLWLYDLKHMDPKRHHALTGIDNKQIIENLRFLVDQKCKVQIRFPLIPTCNDEESNVQALGEFVAGLPGSLEVAVLPYHNLAKSKHDLFEIAYPLNLIREPSTSEIGCVKKILKSWGLVIC